MPQSKEYRVEDLAAAGFSIQILDDNMSPISDLDFAVKIGEESFQRTTDKEGKTRLPKPGEEGMTISLVGNEVDGEEAGAQPTGSASDTTTEGEASGEKDTKEED